MSQMSLKRARRDGTGCLDSGLARIISQDRVFTVDPGSIPPGSVLEHMLSSEWLETNGEINLSHRDPYMVELVVGHLRGLACPPDMATHIVGNLRREALYLGMDALEAETKALLGPLAVEIVPRNACAPPITSAQPGLKHLTCLRLRNVNFNLEWLNDGVTSSRARLELILEDEHIVELKRLLGATSVPDTPSITLYAGDADMFTSPFRATDVHYWLAGHGYSTTVTQDAIWRFLRMCGERGRLVEANEGGVLRQIFALPHKVSDRWRDVAGNHSFALHADRIVLRAYVTGSAADTATGWTQSAGTLVFHSVVMVEACVAADLAARMRTATS